jgi:polyisoprenoid-binding protein YceI
MHRTLKEEEAMETAAQPFTGTYHVDRDHSSVRFAVKHMKVSTFRASFAEIDGVLVAQDGAVTLTASARAESVSIADPPEFREHVVHGSDFFQAGDHPELTFRSTEVELLDNGTARVTGVLTVRGITRTITGEGSYQAPIEDPYGAQRAALELKTTTDRRGWEMNWQMPLPDGGDVLGWDVELTAELELVKAA